MIKQFLDKASKAYYDGNPIISDDEFDRLAEVSGYDKVGADAVKGIPHYFRMYSLQKVHYGEEEPTLVEARRTPKLDGAAISLLYLNGTYSRALTRGDGIKGLDITEKVRHLVPQSFNTVLSAPIQINAELVAPYLIENARNYAAGALNLKSIEEIKTRQLYVVAHDIQPIVAETYYGSIMYLKQIGFMTVMDDCSIFPHDGQVVRENNNERFRAAGFTAKHPRAAYALKPKPTAVITTLIDVEWQVGRSGVVSPVAILEPVMVGDAVVSRATLHNMEYISVLGLELGCRVELIRSGEIIPRIVARVL